MKKMIKAAASAMAVVIAASAVTAAGTVSSSAISKLKAPTSVKVKTLASGYGHYNKITWKKAASVVKYAVYRAKVTGSKTGKYRKIDTATANQYRDYSAASGKYYRYKVASVKGSKTAFGKATKKVVFLNSPHSDFDVNGKYNGFLLKWEAIDGAKKYTIYRSENGGKYKLIKTAKFKKADDYAVIDNSLTTYCSYNDKTVKTGSQYRYYVTAQNGKLRSRQVKNKTARVFNDYDVLLEKGAEKNPLSDIMSLLYMTAGSDSEMEFKTDDESVLDIVHYKEDDVNKVRITGLKDGCAYLQGKGDAAFDGGTVALTTKKIRVKVTSDKVYDIRLKAGETVSSDNVYADKWAAQQLKSNDEFALLFDSADTEVMKVSRSKGKVKLKGVAAGETELVITMDMPEEGIDEIPDEMEEIKKMLTALTKFEMRLKVLVE